MLICRSGLVPVKVLDFVLHHAMPHSILAKVTDDTEITSHNHLHNSNQSRQPRFSPRHSRLPTAVFSINKLPDPLPTGSNQYQLTPTPPPTCHSVRCPVVESGQTSKQFGSPFNCKLSEHCVMYNFSSSTGHFPFSRQESSISGKSIGL
jgi:hypothetical protein